MSNGALTRFVLPAFLALVIAASSLAVQPQVLAAGGNALVLSSVEKLVPTWTPADSYQAMLTRGGVQTTFLRDKQVTVDVLTQLNSYNVIIWRTNVYNWKHTEYWYIGESVNSATASRYQDDFGNGNLNANAGILGVSMGFFAKYFPAGSLSNVRVVVIEASDASGLAQLFINAGAQAVVFYSGKVSLMFGYLDDITNSVVYYLSVGDTVYMSMWNTMTPYINSQPAHDPLDDVGVIPPLWYSGNGNVTI